MHTHTYTYIHAHRHTQPAPNAVPHSHPHSCPTQPPHAHTAALTAVPHSRLGSAKTTQQAPFGAGAFLRRSHSCPRSGQIRPERSHKPGAVIAPPGRLFSQELF